MKVHTFIAESAADAIAQIRAQLGPDAVVLNVRRVAGEGIARLWNAPRIEVLAHVPEAGAGSVSGEAIAQLRQEISQIKQQFGGNTPLPADERPPLARPMRPAVDITPERPARPGWKVKSLLEESGLLPVHAEAVVDDLVSLFGETPPESIAKQMDLARGALHRRWTSPPVSTSGSAVHVFVGAPGVGKTICLCKWLAQSVFLDGARPEVFRLDSSVANTAESLSIYCDILGVSVTRFLDAAARESIQSTRNACFVDFPGVNPTDAAAMDEMARRLKELPNPRVHLVLNAAYDTRLLLGQVRAFEGLGVADLIVTHLDEESRRGKLWNLVLGTNYAIRFLNSGQNVPGEFVDATPERLLAAQFPRNR